MNPIGYAWLINQYGLRCLPLPVTSYLLTTGSRRTIEQDGKRQELYTHHYNPGPTICDHLQFALKHEGVNLEVLAAVFHQLDPHELSQVIKAKPRGVHLRRLCFLYEWLTGARLDCPDLKVGNYISLLDPEQYYTVEGTRSQRHRVLNNLPGTAQFCPLIRRTDALNKYVLPTCSKRHMSWCKSTIPCCWHARSTSSTQRKRSRRMRLSGRLRPAVAQCASWHCCAGHTCSCSIPSPSWWNCRTQLWTRHLQRPITAATSHTLARAACAANASTISVQNLMMCLILWTVCFPCGSASMGLRCIR